MDLTRSMALGECGVLLFLAEYCWRPQQCSQGRTVLKGSLSPCLTVVGWVEDHLPAFGLPDFLPQASQGMRVRPGAIGTA